MIAMKQLQKLLMLMWKFDEMVRFYFAAFQDVLDTSAG